MKALGSPMEPREKSQEKKIPETEVEDKPLPFSETQDLEVRTDVVLNLKRLVWRGGKATHQKTNTLEKGVTLSARQT